MGLGWRLAGRCVRDRYEHELGRFRRRCLAHAPLLRAVEAEVGRLGAALASVDAEQTQQPPHPQAAQAASTSTMAIPPALARQLAAVDSVVLLESRLALWRRLREALLAVATLGPGENMAVSQEEEEQGRRAQQASETEGSSVMVVD